MDGSIKVIWAVSGILFIAAVAYGVITDEHEAGAV